MDEDHDLSKQLESLRIKTITLLKQIINECHVSQIPEITTTLEAYSHQLLADTYLVLVAGEAKRGKSSFINALVGREILPTNVDIATSQVFRISNAAQEAYRIRFEDESTQDISLHDLALYGSQESADSAGIPALKDVIRWIEVNIPAHFLPKGVSILDSPGLGSLYAAHAQITQCLVPLVDGVIFVLDSVQPIIQEELDFIETILNHTSNIFFVQTKIDQQRTEGWQKLQKRNQAILQEHFKGRLADMRVWPVSNTILLKAVRPGKDDNQVLLKVSGQRKMAAELQKFLFRVAGWGRVGGALQAALHSYQFGNRTLGGRLTRLTDESLQKRIKLQQQFKSEWSEGSKKQRELLEALGLILAKEQQKFRKFIGPSGEMEKMVRDRIDGLKSLEKAQEYNKEVVKQILEACLGEWNRTRQGTEDQCRALLTEFLAAAYPLSALEDTSIANVTIKHEDLKLEDDLLSYFKQASEEGRKFLTIPTAFPTLSDGLSIAVLAALLWTGIRVWLIRKNAQLAEAKQQLHEHVDGVLTSVRQKFLDAPTAVDRRNYLDEYFYTLAHNVQAEMKKVAERKSAEAQAEVDIMHKAGTEQIQEQMSRWEKFFPAMREILKDLKSLDQALSIPSTPII